MRENKTVCHERPKLHCRYCGDGVIVWLCGRCSQIVICVCRGCHNDLEHGIPPRVTDSHPSVDINRNSEGSYDESPGWDDAVKIIEGW